MDLGDKSCITSGYADAKHNKAQDENITMNNVKSKTVDSSKYHHAIECLIALS